MNEFSEVLVIVCPPTPGIRASVFLGRLVVIEEVVSLFFSLSPLLSHFPLFFPSPDPFLQSSFTYNNGTSALSLSLSGT